MLNNGSRQTRRESSFSVVRQPLVFLIPPLVIGLALIVAASRVIDVSPRPQPAPPALPLPPHRSIPPDRYVPLGDIPWRSATTGWQVLADRDGPILDSSFTYDAMSVAGQTFDRGIATYPLSDIVYELDPHTVRFRSSIGVTDDSAGEGSVRFSVYGDDLLLYASAVVRAGTEAESIDVDIEGVRQLRLVVDDAGDGSLGDYALWADPQLGVIDAQLDTSTPSDVARAIQEQRGRDARSEADEEARLRDRTAAVRSLLSQRLPAGSGAQAAIDGGSSSALLANQQIGVALGYGGQQNGRLTVLDRDASLPVLLDVSPRIVLEDGSTFALTTLQPDSVGQPTTIRIDDPYQGGGAQVRARFRVGTGGALDVALTVFDTGRALRLGLSSEGVRLRAVQYLDPTTGSVVLGDDARYLTDRSHLYQGSIFPDGRVRRAPVEATEPALLWSDGDQRGVLFALMDYVPSPLWLSMERAQGRRAASVGLQLTAQLDDFGPDAASPPPLTIELTSGPLGAGTFQLLRSIAAARYPQEPLPPGARFQWGSWYAYGPGVDADGFVRQARLLANRFGDLGRWQMLLDAGWYVQYGREDAELGNVDTAKFPNGIGAVADAVHSLGMDLILYLGTGFVHDSTANGGEWLALTGLIHQHPDWMIPFQTVPSPVHRYLLDYKNPAVQDYVGGVVRDILAVHRADGILVDGLADAEGQLIPRTERDSPTGPPHPLLPTLDIYRLVRTAADTVNPNAFISGGWLNPLAADPDAQIFFYADESDQIDAPYPFPGFLQKLDYALFNMVALNQRTYVGAAMGEPTRPDAHWWIQASAALGVPAIVDLNLDRLDPATVAAFRADLREVDPSSGVTRYMQGVFPPAFATTRDGVTYLGVVNRAMTDQSISLSLDQLGLVNGQYTALDASTGQGQSVQGSFAVDMPGRSFRYFVLRPDAGLLRTDSSATIEVSDQSAGIISIAVQGPSDVPGFAQIAAPEPSTVFIDGAPATRVADPAAAMATAGTYAFDGGIVTVGYAHRGKRQVQVRW